MTRFDPRRRAEGLEMMDAPEVGAATLRGCLGDLERVNRLTFAYRPTLAFLDRLAREGRLPEGRALSILDVGSGNGDGLRAIARWGRRRSVALRLIGLDLSPASALAARERAGAQEIVFVTGDVFDYRPETPPDLVVSSLFTHHLSDAEVVRFLVWMEETARLGWFVNDLRRSRLSFHGFRLLARVMGWHPFVRHDGPLSIARSFRAAEWRAALAGAGLDPRAARVYRAAPFRLCVARVKP